MALFVRLLAVFLFVASAPICAQDLLEKAREIQSRVIGIDSHNDTLQRILIEHADIGKHLPDGQVDLPRLREGGIHAPFFALWAPTYYKGSEAVRRTLELRDAMQTVFDKYPDQIELATSASDVERIIKQKKIAVVLTVEGGHQIASDLAVLRMYRRLGIRSMTLTHFRNTDWADSSTDNPAHNGLTEFGKEVVREMNRIGMIIDVSHVSDKTFYDVLEVTNKPVIASHSSCRALCDVSRNMSDDMLRALARNGGVVGINFGARFLNPKDAQGLKPNIAQIAATEPDLQGRMLDEFAAKDYFTLNWSHAAIGSATVEDAAAHIDHVAKIAGIDHVGIGSDWDGIDRVPQGLEDVSKMPALTAALLKRGFSEAAIKKILGENFSRVMREVVGR